MNSVIYGINGPVVTVYGNKDLKMLEMVKVGDSKLIGEVIGNKDHLTIIQVYESTAGLKPGEPVEGTGHPLSVTLAPGIIGNIFDGIERPLKEIMKQSGVFIDTGMNVNALDVQIKRQTNVLVKCGDFVSGGDIFAVVEETKAIKHKLLVPNALSGTVSFTVPDGQYTIKDIIIKITNQRGREKELDMITYWPIRTPRPFAKRLEISKPLITGQRIIDTFFPIAMGGTAAIPGGFGTGKTMTQHQLAKWSDADVIVYIGCGERGNEMTQVLEDFSKLTDPKTGNSLMDRTILIANTSNMPVAAREASIYTGVTIGEYYRDMGYHVAVMADSTSRWAEALREISGRLEEMPAEEGFPAYLPSRISGFYERAGLVENFNKTQGSISIIGAVSPQSDDFSEPVTQNTKRFIRVFWALDRQLAYARHYPAIHWLGSYSEYEEDLEPWYKENVDPRFMEYRFEILRILQQESSLMEIVKLIGADVLPDDQKLILETARVVRLGILQQNAYHRNDTYVPLLKQFKMMELVIKLWNRASELTSKKIPVSRIKESGLFERLIGAKYEISNDDLQGFDQYMKEIDLVLDGIQESNTQGHVRSDLL